MKKHDWETFDRLTVHCYENMIGAYKDNGCWQEAFQVLAGIAKEAREKDKNCVQEICQLAEMANDRCDVLGWLEDYTDELEMLGQWETLLESCEWLISFFAWKEVSVSEVKFLKADALGELGREEEAETFCRDWQQQAPEDVKAAAALVYILLKQERLQEAEELVKRYIGEDDECTDTNDVLFIAAERLYEINGDKTGQRRIRQALEKYDEYLGESFFGEEELEDEFPF